MKLLKLCSLLKLPRVREATRDKKQLDFGFLLKGGGGVKPESKVSEELLKEPFFSLSLDIFKERGGGATSKPYEEFVSA